MPTGDSMNFEGDPVQGGNFTSRPPMGIVARWETALEMRRCENPLTNADLDRLVERFPARWADIHEALRQVPPGH